MLGSLRPMSIGLGKGDLVQDDGSLGNGSCFSWAHALLKGAIMTDGPIVQEMITRQERPNSMCKDIIVNDGIVFLLLMGFSSLIFYELWDVLPSKIESSCNEYAPPT